MAALDPAVAPYAAVSLFVSRFARIRAERKRVPTLAPHHDRPYLLRCSDRGAPCARLRPRLVRMLMLELSNRSRRAPRLHRFALFLGLASSFLSAGLLGQPVADASVRRVQLADLVAAISSERQRGYTITATSNGARFQAGVFRTLVERARAADPSRSRLLIDPRDNAHAFMAATGLGADELPSFVRLAWRYGQYQLVDYGADRVIAHSESERPALAISVVTWWPDSAGGPETYSYVDTLAQPSLRVTNHRVVSYRVLYFDDMVVYDDVQGISGRPLTGLLGLLFDVIGDGRAIQSRSALSRDGLQVTSSMVRKGFITLTPTATIYPDGHIVKDVPPNRHDLDAIAARLKRPLAIEYGPAPRPLAIGRRY